MHLHINQSNIDGGWLLGWARWVVALFDYKPEYEWCMAKFLKFKMDMNMTLYVVYCILYMRSLPTGCMRAPRV